MKIPAEIIQYKMVLMILFVISAQWISTGAFKLMTNQNIQSCKLRALKANLPSKFETFNAVSGGNNRRSFLRNLFFYSSTSYALVLVPKNLLAAEEERSKTDLKEFGIKLNKFSQDISSLEEFDVLAKLRSELNIQVLIDELSKYISTLGAFEAQDTSKLTDKILRSMNRDYIQMEDISRGLPINAVGKARVKALQEPLTRFEKGYRALLSAIGAINGEESVYTKRPLFQLCPDGYLLC
mmetsp:Transcript_38257/g.50408  ORF Transcript_38257/g.50408 Transcript_38257/m.50408 type:complete len:239 (+) Transcript_38257:51-767(+)